MKENRKCGAAAGWKSAGDAKAAPEVSEEYAEHCAGEKASRPGCAWRKALAVSALREKKLESAGRMLLTGGMAAAAGPHGECTW
ncbi:hypothetical protein EYF80_031206 [Liparis tanakae]|uniref:Uncharacterized protein n=1 Tax=Liparis tanakae TaxID=230148 RepID=A0A4Z2GYI0_9TELE|nr:hypothetical protein EYF80_031206 [Liparis tanakae]